MQRSKKQGSQQDIMKKNRSASPRSSSNDKNSGRRRLRTIFTSRRKKALRRTTDRSNSSHNSAVLHGAAPVAAVNAINRNPTISSMGSFPTVTPNPTGTSTNDAKEEPKKTIIKTPKTMTPKSKSAKNPKTEVSSSVTKAKRSFFWKRESPSTAVPKNATAQAKQQQEQARKKIGSTKKSRKITKKEMITRKISLKHQKHFKELAKAAAVSKETFLKDKNSNIPPSIENLQDQIQHLSQKASYLETQLILVTVQQLDLLAHALSGLFVSMIVLIYWVLVWKWLIPTYWNESFLLDDNDDMMLMMNETSSTDQVTPLGHVVWWILQYPMALIIFPATYHAWTNGLMLRRCHVFAVFWIVMIRIKLCRWREDHFIDKNKKQSDDNPTMTTTDIPKYGESCTEDSLWEVNYEISARFLYLSILQLQGLWIKTAQYMSSRSDFVPTAYIRELSKLQDQAPSTDWKTLIQSGTIPSYIQKALTNIDPVPMASASIGQVHKAQLKTKSSTKGNDSSDNVDVVMKVQHPQAQRLMTDDFRTLLWLCRITGWLEPDYVFMEIIMREWATEAKKELDFRIEASHMQEARHALSQQQAREWKTNAAAGSVPFSVHVPQPYMEFTTRKVLVMEYCDGVRVDDFETIDNHYPYRGISRTAMMDGIAQAFAYFMYSSTIFNADPHAGNLLVRPGLTAMATTTKDASPTKATTTKGKSATSLSPSSKSGTSARPFTIIILDWGLAKRLSEDKRLAFCQMVYAAATFDYGLLLDSYETIGLKLKREDSGQGMHDMRFFLRDMEPRDIVRSKIKRQMKEMKRKQEESQEKVPMESKAYPGEFFFFIRVNELLHGLGSRFQNVRLNYLETLRPYAEHGIRTSPLWNTDQTTQNQTTKNVGTITGHDAKLQLRLQKILLELESKQQLVGAQVCVLGKDGRHQADLVVGDLGGLKSHVPMTPDALVLGFSTTKAITATLAHLMVQEGYLHYDEPICERVWTAFCPTPTVPPELTEQPKSKATATLEKQWKWKRSITLRHILNHTAGLGATFPPAFTVKKMASCEDCFQGYEYNSHSPQDYILPDHQPGKDVSYHYLSFGWLVAGTLCGAYTLKHPNKKEGPATYQQVYEALLAPRLSAETKSYGFQPLGVRGDNMHPMAQTVTADMRVATLMQQHRETEVYENHAPRPSSKTVPASSELLKSFQGKEFLFDPRIWNNRSICLNANVPAAGGRFSARGLAHFYCDLGRGKLISKVTLESLRNIQSKETSTASSNIKKKAHLSAAKANTTDFERGMNRVTNDATAVGNPTKLSHGYQWIKTKRDATFSGMGHAGVGGSIGFFHARSGVSVAVMLNKADGNNDETVVRLVEAVADHYKL